MCSPSVRASATNRLRKKNEKKLVKAMNKADRASAAKGKQNLFEDEDEEEDEDEDEDEDEPQPKKVKAAPTGNERFLLSDSEGEDEGEDDEEGESEVEGDEEEDEESDEDDGRPAKTKAFTSASPFTDDNQDWLRLATGGDGDDDDSDDDDEQDEFDLGVPPTALRAALFLL